MKRGTDLFYSDFTDAIAGPATPFPRQLTISFPPNLKLQANSACPSLRGEATNCKRGVFIPLGEVEPARHRTLDRVMAISP